jgi:acyl carrier protein
VSSIASPDAEIYVKLTQVFREVFRREDIVLTPELTSRDVPGWDSFRQVEIILAVEHCFDITLSSDDVDELENAGDLVRTIAAKTRIGSDH